MLDWCFVQKHSLDAIFDLLVVAVLADVPGEPSVSFCLVFGFGLSGGETFDLVLFCSYFSHSHFPIPFQFILLFLNSVSFFPNPNDSNNSNLVCWGWCENVEKMCVCLWCVEAFLCKISINSNRIRSLVYSFSRLLFHAILYMCKFIAIEKQYPSFCIWQIRLNNFFTEGCSLGKSI